MRYKKTVGSVIFDGFNILLQILLMLFFLYPIWYVFSVSISSLDAVAMDKVVFYPIGFSLKAYKDVLRDSAILTAYRNTIVYALAFVAIVLFFTSMTAYPLTSRTFRGKKFFNIFFVVPMFLNAGMIPLYMVVKEFHLIDNPLSILLPSAVTGFNLVVFRTNFQSLPYELRESAMIDGAGHFKILFTIVLPLSLPIIMSIALFSIVAQWNNFREPLLFLNKQDLWPLQLTLRRLIINNEMTGSDMMQAANIATGNNSINRVGYYEALKMAAIMVSIGPIILVYPFVQKYFLKGMLIGAVKG